MSSYPKTRTDDIADDFHGTTVSDPYRWLEDQTSGEVAGWARAQAEVTRSYLETLPGRDGLRARLEQLSSLPTSTAPHLRGGRWFRRTNSGSQQQTVLRVSEEPLADGHVLIDPNLASADGTTALAGAEADPTGRMVVWSYQEAGSDWCRWRVRYIDTGVDLSDDVRWSKFTRPLWLADSSGFFYSRYPAADENDPYSAVNGPAQLLLHRLGTTQDADEVLFDRPEEASTTIWPDLDDTGRWLVAVLDDSAADTRSVWVRDLTEPDGELRQLTPASSNEWEFVTAEGNSLLMRTDLDAGRGRIVRLDAITGELSTVVAEHDDLLLDATAGPGVLVINWLADARSKVTVHDRSGDEISRVVLPGLGSVTEVVASTESSLVHLSYTSYGSTPQILAHDLDTGLTTTVFAAAAVPGPELVTDQIWLTSADGTRLPAFVVHRADVTPENGPHSTTLYGYGGFNIPVTPAFSSLITTYVEAGGVWVVATLRGGGEYGADWHDAGRLARKQNVFDDAIATAEHLIATGWTTSEQLAINGGSNGGLLVGALLTQRPDLFAAAAPQVGVLDMLRFQRFTIGWAWTSDYGDATRSDAEFQTLYAYSPLHRLTEGTAYPPTLVMTADHDDRVVPAHSFKFAARLQAVSEAPAYLRVEYSAGHGLGKSRSTLVNERADLLAFIARHTGLQLP